MLAHVPIWVFGIFALLLSLGILLSRPRAVHPVSPSLIAAAFGLYSLYGAISAFGASSATIPFWAAGMVASTLLGKPYLGPSGVTRISGTSKVLVPGSWLPLVLMMGIFLAKFLVGFVQGANLHVGTHVWFAPAVCLILGLLSGGFASRALNIRRWVRAAR